MSEFLSQLNPEQADAAGTVNGPVLVLAGAGTGKTRVITFRIAHMLSIGILPEQILGMTFTNKAAREMRERLAQLVDPKVSSRVTLGTFHSFCIRILRREAAKLGYLPGFTIADDSDQQGLLKQAAGAAGCNTREGFPLAEVQAQIGRWKNKLLFPKDAKRFADNGYEETCAIIYEHYQELLELQNSLDFDDMLLLVHKLFTEHPDVLAKYQERYRYLLIDEYQDTNAAQFTIVKLLIGDRCNLCVVGDDDQSIYSWRGADISNILNFPDHFPGAKVVKLEQNYRSTSSILNAANAVIGSNANRHDKKLWSNLGEGEKVQVVKTAGGEAEADFIAGMIKQLHGSDGFAYRDFAILYRSNHLSRELEQAMRRSQIPYRLVGGQEFYKRREIKDAVSYLKLIVNPHDDQSLLRILGTPPRGLAAKAVDQLKIGRATAHTPMIDQLGLPEFQKALPPKAAQAAKELNEVYKSYREQFREPGRLAAKIISFLRDVGYLDGLQRIYKDLNDSMKRRENVDEFINAIAQFEQRQPEPPTLESYLESFALLEENDRTEEDETNGDAVTLLTVHASKGLEFPVVFCVALERNIFPHERAIEEGSVEEELRLFYVAITRARKQLYITRAARRMQRGMLQPALPSPFLELLTDDVAEFPAPEDLLRPASEDSVRQAFADIFKMLDKRNRD
ncbi:MAG: UvrD-helicase domain-containing protein [Lentisphaeria bacterium]|nr:UvrD-helicase domain-containing protein [Lentisphaeria bacterium]